LRTSFSRHEQTTKRRSRYSWTDTRSTTGRLLWPRVAHACVSHDEAQSHSPRPRPASRTATLTTSACSSKPLVLRPVRARPRSPLCVASSRRTRLAYRPYALRVARRRVPHGIPRALAYGRTQVRPVPLACLAIDDWLRHFDLSRHGYPNACVGLAPACLRLASRSNGGRASPQLARHPAELVRLSWLVTSGAPRGRLLPAQWGAPRDICTARQTFG
jgi:hypothetical protein